MKSQSIKTLQGLIKSNFSLCIFTYIYFFITVFFWKGVTWEFLIPIVGMLGIGGMLGINSYYLQKVLYSEKEEDKRIIKLQMITGVILLLLFLLPFIINFLKIISPFIN